MYVKSKLNRYHRHFTYVSTNTNPKIKPVLRLFWNVQVCKISNFANRTTTAHYLTTQKKPNISFIFIKCIFN